MLYVRYTLSTLNNSRLVITKPKTRSSKNWGAISPRVTTPFGTHSIAHKVSVTVQRSPTTSP
ncbi:hypothetical protein [Streptomyces antimycoticus]|uniref:hypothetical protein n=1 Tax=Streptomyces antimycoticus TaxID=68175 RepID=UPI00117F6A71|nr:hypothetical protein [Streptomyces antimycoticus]